MTDQEPKGANGESSSHRRELERAAGTPLPGKISDTLKKPLPRRFYREAAISGKAPYEILLDGRAVKTPKKRALQLPTRELAAAVRDEWNAQEAVIDPARMPLTRFANTAIDAVSDELDAVAADIVSYAGSDFLCYRAESPEKLRVLQAENWNPIVARAEIVLKESFRIVSGVTFVPQPPETLKAVANALQPHDAFRLTALHVLTTLTGSALLALALGRFDITPEAAWAAAHVDEDYQIAHWGEDGEAAARRRGREIEFNAACRWLAAISNNSD